MKAYQPILLSASLGIGLLLSAPAQAVTVEDVPNPRFVSGGWVSDTANLISPEGETQLNQLLSDLEAQSGTEMTVVTVDETKPAASPRAFTTDLFNFWGVGKAEQDNGVVFLVSEGDRRAEVVVGYGLKAVLTQTEIELLLQREAIPDFKQENYEQGIIDASEALVNELFEPVAIASGEENSPGEALTLPNAVSRGISRNNQIPAIGSLVGLGGIAIALFGLLKKRPKLKCDRCQTDMVKMDSGETTPHLSKAQSVAVQINSAAYTGWRCPSCREVSIRRHRSYFKNGYSSCPHCQEPTVNSTRKTIRPATSRHRGRAEVSKLCKCCGYTDIETILLARLADSTASHHASHHVSSHLHNHNLGGGSSGGGGFSGGSSGGSSSGGFGGGSSGGGGGGASW